MKSEVLALVEELKRLRKQGVDRVYVSDQSLQALRGRMIDPTRDAATKAEVLESIPEQVRSASAVDFDKMIVESAKPASAQRKTGAAKGARLPPPPEVELPSGDKRAQWESLRERVLNCPVCASRVKEGKRVVFGVGSLDAAIFFCGEAPGADEEEQGEPFVGKAGQLLTKMIQAAGLRREDVYIGNIMNWRPEMPTPVGNRPPTEEEMTFCLPYLRAQLEIVRPKVIVALGVTAAKGLLGFKAFRNLREIKGEWQDFEGTPVMPTYHPSYLLHNSSHRDKRLAWEDWLKVMEKAGLPISERQRNYFL